jgi:periplasmic protein TonB
MVRLAAVQTAQQKPVSKPNPAETAKPVAKPKPADKPKPAPRAKPIIKPKPAVRPKPVEKANPKPKPVEKAQPKPASKPQPKPPELPKPQPVSAPKPPAVDTTTIENRYLSVIYRSIDKRKIYPRIAKRLGQSGVVKVRFTVQADGSIVNISLAQSSGFSLLDSAAEKILTELAKTDPIPKALGKARLTITVPVSYLLR